MKSFLAVACCLFFCTPAIANQATPEAGGELKEINKPSATNQNRAVHPPNYSQDIPVPKWRSVTIIFDDDDQQGAVISIGNNQPVTQNEK